MEENKDNLNMPENEDKKMTDTNKKVILVVDDEKPIRDILVYNLQKEGYETIEAEDGETAIKVALDRRVDLILLDIMLPKVDGLTVCQRLRHTLNVPILILSAKDEEIDKSSAIHYKSRGIVSAGSHTTCGEPAGYRTFPQEIFCAQGTV